MARIGIIGAMEVEVDTLRNMLTDSRITTRAGMKFCEGRLEGTEVVVVRSGIGKVNAAMCTQILADIFNVTHIINTGVAGSLNADINISDIVISTDLMYHDMDATGLGYAPGIIPEMDSSVFSADETMIKLAEETCAEVNPDIRSFRGRIVSGDKFVSGPDSKDIIVKNFSGFCTEMEGCAIAHASTLNGIPFVVLRAISDKADNSAHMDYPSFEKAAAERSAKLVIGMARKLAL